MVTRPTDNARDFDHRNDPSAVMHALELANDMIVAALLCGTCRVATLSPFDGAWQFFLQDSNFVFGTQDSSPADWHHNAHNASQLGESDPATLEAARWIQEAHRGFFEHVFFDLLRKMDVEDGYGGTLLDRSLVVWSPESCHYTHDNHSTPIVTAGSAGGALRTGSYVDYRDMTITFKDGPRGGFNPGLTWNQFLGSVLEVMGVPRAEFEQPLYQDRPAGVGTGGYGAVRFDREDPHESAPASRAVYRSALSSMGEIPPYLTPG